MTRLTDSEVERALSQAPNLDLAHESVRRVAINLDDLISAGLELDTALDLATALVGTLDSARGGTHTRNVACDHARSLARDLAIELARDLPHDLARDVVSLVDTAREFMPMVVPLLDLVAAESSVAAVEPAGEAVQPAQVAVSVVARMVRVLPVGDRSRMARPMPRAAPVMRAFRPVRGRVGCSVMSRWPFRSRR